jgi:hypothetical protein
MAWHGKDERGKREDKRGKRKEGGPSTYLDSDIDALRVAIRGNGAQDAVPVAAGAERGCCCAAVAVVCAG